MSKESEFENAGKIDRNLSTPKAREWWRAVDESAARFKELVPAKPKRVCQDEDLTCPGCGFIMQYRRGKEICFNCGYFESCCGG